MAGVNRVLLRYHGGKWTLAPWILSFFTKHEKYVEGFGEGASILLRKKRSKYEVYNDLDSDIVNVFEVLRENGSKLINQLRNTPFSRNEYRLSLKPADNNLEQARRTIIRSFFGFGSASVTGQQTSFRPKSSGGCPSKDWYNYVQHLKHIKNRLSGVVIENRDAIHVAKQHDAITTLHYFDPPYLPKTRNKKLIEHDIKSYRYEMSFQDHIDFLQDAKELKGMVLISGYYDKIYQEILEGWEIKKVNSFAMNNLAKTECLWLNLAAQKAQPQPTLFDQQLNETN